MNTRITITAALALIYLLFFGWYSSFSGPVTQQEIDEAISHMSAQGANPDQLANLRYFLENDSGDDFVMLNFIQFNPAESVPGADRNTVEAQTILSNYMAYMWPALLSRACHPVVVGSAASPSLDVWGVTGARYWDQGAAMRYRSRRDLMEIATNPEFQGPHEFKFDAMAKTIAFPIDPWMSAGDPRLLLALILIIVGLLINRAR